ncbi:cytochrome P450 [Streptomyces phaeochromogenes]|nr:cytochrome P450 [Streptomyces phaeochromogenes]
MIQQNRIPAKQIPFPTKVLSRTHRPKRYIEVPSEMTDTRNDAGLGRADDGGEPVRDGKLRSLDVSDLPEPRGLPLVGHVPALARGGVIHRVLHEWCDQHGPTFRIRLGTQTVVVTASPDIIGTVLRERPEKYRRGQAMGRLIAELGAAGLFDAEGDDWRILRKVAMKGLNAGYLRDSFATISRSTGRLRDQWSAAAAAGEIVPVLDDLMRYTLEMTVGMTMDHDLDAVRRRDEDGPHQHLPQVLTTLGQRLNSPVPYWRWVRMPSDRRADAAVEEFSALIRDQYVRAKHLITGGKRPSTFLESLAEAERDGGDITEQRVISAVLNMIIAGEDNIAATTAWATHYLATHPEVQRLVREEAAEVLGDASHPADPSVVARLKYAEAVVNETIRMRPTAPYLLLEAMTDTTLADSTMQLSLTRGTHVMPLLGYKSDSDAQKYPNPGEFDPGRWLPKLAEQLDGAPSFLPFGAGPRFCPGRNLALLEAVVFVSMACHNFLIEADTSGGPVEERLTFVVLPTNLSVRLKSVR